MPRPLVDPRFGVTLRRLRLERGLSLRALARLAVFGKSYLHDLERGTREPTAATARRLDEVLEVGGRLAALVNEPPECEVDNDRVAYGVAHPDRLDAETVASLAIVLAHQRRLEDAVGSASLLAPVLAQSAVIRELVRQSAGSAVWPGLMAVAAEWACYTGWLTATTGRHAAGRRWYRQSQSWAEEIGQADLTSSALQMQGHLAWVQGRHDDMLALSREASERGRSPGVRSIAVQQEARALALIGDRDGCARTFGRAEALSLRAADHPNDTQDWLYFYDGAFLTMQRGLADHYLGRHERAVDELTAGMGRLPHDLRSSDWVAWYVVRLAESQAAAADVTAATASLASARSVAQRTGAARLLADVDDVAHRLDG